MKIAIVGGGAAGLMCAATILESDPHAEVFLIEKNDGLGKKVIISGGGRCNVTTGIQDIRTVLSRYPRGGKFLSSAMHQFSPTEVYRWFESHGVPLKIEEDLRVFPRSNNGHDIVRIFEKIFVSHRVTILLKTAVSGVRAAAKGFELSFKGDQPTLLVDAVVLTTGGQAYRQTGSTGDGYAFAVSLGHAITPLAPSLNAFFTREKWPAMISGLSFEKGTLSTKREKIYTFTGPFLFTHKGVSGPAVFALSSLIAFEVYDEKQPLSLKIDIFPDESSDALRHRFETAINASPKKSLVNVLAALLPKSFAQVVSQELGLDPEKRANELAKKDIGRIVAWLKAIPLTVIARGAGDEFVTAGGVELTEVNPSTMESKITPGLYFAGEILNIDGFTGGFNLQSAWATGHLAGQSITMSQDRASP